MHFHYLLYLLLTLIPLHFDIIHLKDGRKLKGEISKKGKKYFLKMKFGSIWLDPAEIESIEKTDKKIQKKKDNKDQGEGEKGEKKDSDHLYNQYIKKKSILKPKDTQGRIKLARWCYQRGLKKPAQELLQKVLRLDPMNEKAFYLYDQWFGLLGRGRARYKRKGKKLPAILRQEIPFAFQKATWKEVILYLERATNLEIKVPPSVQAELEKKKMRISYRHTGVKLIKALRVLSRALGLGWKLEGETLSFHLKKGEKKGLEVAQILARKRFTLDFDTRLGKFLTFMSQKTTVKFTLDANVSRDLPVKLKVSEEKATTLLKKALSPHGLDYVVLDGLVYISTREKCRSMKK